MSGTETLLAELARLANGPLTAATAMPPGLYHDPAIFARERDRLFARGWLCPGLAAEIAEARRLPQLLHQRPAGLRHPRRGWRASAPSPMSACTG